MEKQSNTKQYLHFEPIESTHLPMQTQQTGINQSTTGLPAAPLVDWQWAKENTKAAATVIIRLFILVAPWLFFGGLAGIIIVTLIKAVLAGMIAGFALAVTFLISLFKLFFAAIFIVAGLFILFMLIKAAVVSANSGSGYKNDTFYDETMSGNYKGNINITINPEIRINSR